MPAFVAALVGTLALAGIDWHAPPACPDADEVERRARALGPGVADAPLHAAVAQRDDGAFELALVDDRGPAHTYVARECSALADIVALSLAVAIDPVEVASSQAEQITARTSAAIPAPPLRMDEPAIASTPAAAPVRREPRRRAPLSGFVRVQGSFGAAELPGFDGGLGLALGIGRGAGRFELHATHLFARTTALPIPGRNITAELASWNLSPRGCGLIGRRAVRAVLCAGAELGIVVAQSHDAIHDGDGTGLWVAAIAAPGLEWAVVPWLRLYAGADLVLALRRPQFALHDRDADRVTLGAGGLRAVVGVAGHFGGDRRIRRRP